MAVTLDKPVVQRLNERTSRLDGRGHAVEVSRVESVTHRWLVFCNGANDLVQLIRRLTVDLIIAGVSWKDSRFKSLMQAEKN